MFKQSFVFASLFLATILNAHGQSKENYPDCFVIENLAVGEVPNQPFTARVVEVAQRILQTGLSTSDGAPESTVGFIARDREGRVSAKWRPSLIGHGSQNDDPDHWKVLLCNPGTGRNTSINYRSAESPGEDGLPLIPNDAKEINAVSSPQDGRTTAVFAYWHNVVKGRDNLREETFAGLPAYRYRSTRTHDEGSVRDVVNSDELYLQLAQTTWKQYPSIEENLHLIEVKRDEPLPDWFNVPQNITVAVK